MANKIFVCDLDGTLSNSEWRSHFAAAGEWDEFHSKSKLDSPHADVCLLIQMLVDVGNECIVVTGRSESYRKITEDWLTRHSIPVHAVLMRMASDWGPATTVKVKLLSDYLDKNGLSKSDVMFALDDNERMIDAWRAWGIPAYQVRAGTVE